MSKIELVKVNDDIYNVVGFEDSEVIHKIYVKKPVRDFGWDVCVEFKRNGKLFFYSHHTLGLDELLDILQDDYENEIMEWCIKRGLYCYKIVK